MTAENGGRVTTRELFEAVLDQNRQREEMERRLTDKVNGLNVAVSNISKQPAICQAYFEGINKRIDSQEDDIERLKLWDKGLAVLAIVGSAIAAALGFNNQ